MFVRPEKQTRYRVAVNEAYCVPVRVCVTRRVKDEQMWLMSGSICVTITAEVRLPFAAGHIMNVDVPRSTTGRWNA